MAGMLDALASYIENMLLEMTKEEVHLLLGVPNEINRMDTKLRDLKSFLADADKRNITDESVRSWVVELRNAMYDATDILDLCQLKAMKQGPKQDAGCLNPLLFCMRNPLHAHDIGTRIKKLNKRLDDIEKRSKTFNLNSLASYDDCTRKPESSHHGRYEATGEEELGVVGEKIEEDTRDLVGLLTRKEKTIHEHNKIMVFAIVGVGGIGKTTLAKNIFNNEIIKQEFEKRIWLSVNQEFSDVDLLERVIIEARGHNLAPRNTKTTLERTLKESLQGCKTLLVMDDVWDYRAWERVLKPPLINSLARGSRVIVTTRDDTVARGMMAKVPYHHVDKIGLEDAWSLLKNQVVGNGCNDEQKVDALKDIGMGIIARCDGLPLAVKVMGGLLRQKKTRRSDWENVVKNFIWSVSQLPEELNYAVYLSYQDLHPKLKPCFLHYALLPKSTMFGYADIISMWISEGFVHENSCDLEVLGREYYDQLIARNLIEPNMKFVDQAVCNMHDVVRTFAHCVARDETLIVHGSGASLTNQLNLKNVIRLSLETKKTESNELGWSSLQAHTSLRTLILVGQIKINLGDSLLSFPCLRTLHIEDGNFDALSGSLVQLRHLRYLSIRGTDTSRLPENIAKMKLLQYINLTRCQRLHKLPAGIVNIQQLRFLCLNQTGIDTIPRGFHGLTKLRYLYGFPVHMEGDWCSLEELGPINQLMDLQIRELENVSSSSIAIKARLSEKVHLRTLALVCTRRRGDDHLLIKEEEQQQIKMVFDELCPPPCLEYLDIRGYFSERLPRWMTSIATASLGSLRVLIMKGLPFCTEIPDGLCQLPCLEFLMIKNAPAIKRVGLEFLVQHPIAMGNLGSDLKIVVSKCSNLESISNIPKLQNLEVFMCPKLKVLEGLPALQKLVLKNYSMGTLPRYLQDVNPWHLEIDCSLRLLTCIAAGKSSPEWGKFYHVKQIKAYADEEGCPRKWYVKYMRNPFSFRTNISRLAIHRSRVARAWSPYSNTCSIEDVYVVERRHASTHKRQPLCGRFRWQACAHLQFWLRQACLHCNEVAGIASSNQWIDDAPR